MADPALRRTVFKRVRPRRHDSWAKWEELTPARLFTGHPDGPFIDLVRELDCGATVTVRYDGDPLTVDDFRAPGERWFKVQYRAAIPQPPQEDDDD